MDNSIRWYEALILFLWYGAYVGFMKFNESVEDYLRSLLKLPKIVRNLPCMHCILYICTHYAWAGTRKGGLDYG